MSYSWTIYATCQECTFYRSFSLSCSFYSLSSFIISHFRVNFSLYFKASLHAKLTNYHDKNIALRLAWKERLSWTRKWPIALNSLQNLKLCNTLKTDRHYQLSGIFMFVWYLHCRFWVSTWLSQDAANESAWRGTEVARTRENRGRKGNRRWEINTKCYISSFIIVSYKIIWIEKKSDFSSSLIQKGLRVTSYLRKRKLARGLEALDYN